MPRIHTNYYLLHCKKKKKKASEIQVYLSLFTDQLNSII